MLRPSSPDSAVAALPPGQVCQSFPPWHSQLHTVLGLQPNLRLMRLAPQTQRRQLAHRLHVLRRLGELQEQLADDEGDAVAGTPTTGSIKLLMQRRA